jgi:hypothetical protein
MRPGGIEPRLPSGPRHFPFLYVAISRTSIFATSCKIISLPKTQIMDNHLSVHKGLLPKRVFFSEPPHQPGLDQMNADALITKNSDFEKGFEFKGCWDVGESKLHNVEKYQEHFSVVIEVEGLNRIRD